ncbi:MAG: hypothetical protein FWC41_13255 [Firmicutes bacterium]|nr:hypothetical protein [Bacillota bacterium]
MSANMKIEPKLLKTISKMAKDKNTTENKIINQILKEKIEISKENKIPEHLLMNPNRKPDPELSKELIGIIEAKEPFNVAKAIREIRGIE